MAKAARRDVLEGFLISHKEGWAILHAINLLEKNVDLDTTEPGLRPSLHSVRNQLTWTLDPTDWISEVDRAREP